MGINSIGNLSGSLSNVLKRNFGNGLIMDEWMKYRPVDHLSWFSWRETKTYKIM